LFWLAWIATMAMLLLAPHPDSVSCWLEWGALVAGKCPLSMTSKIANKCDRTVSPLCTEIERDRVM
jgi:hypothetical protein